MPRRNDTLGTLFDYLGTTGVAGSREREFYFSLYEGGRLRRLCLHGICVPCVGPVEIRLLACPGREEEGGDDA